MAKGFSLHIGINNVDPLHYAGWDGFLSKCENDAHFMSSIAELHGFTERQLLLTTDANSKNVIGAMKKLASELVEGDILLLSYSGHGGSIRDISGDEDDWVDETWCLHDRQFIDDELNNLLALFSGGVRILVISDSCHSGTVTKDNYELRWTDNQAIEDANVVKKKMPNFVADFIYSKKKEFYDEISKNLENPNITLEEVNASVLLISGCQDDQSSYIIDIESIKYSVFTEGMHRVFNKGLKFDNYKDFYEAIVNELKGFKKQLPNFFLTGAKNLIFEKQAPFSI